MQAHEGRQMPKHEKEKGYVLASTAALLVVLCGFAALALDIGVFLSERAAAQRAADSAALAGAFTFVSNPLAPQPGTARAQALATATSNQILNQTITAGEVSVNVDVGGRLVTVDITHASPTFFGRVYMSQVTIGARGIAEAAQNATGSACSKPWFVPNTVASALGPCPACAAGEVFVANGQVTPFGLSRLGAPFTIKPNNPSDALAPGQFFAIALPGSTGGADYRDNIGKCSPEVIYCQSVYPVEPGNMIGPTLQGVRDFIGPNPDVFLSVGRYQRSDGVISDTSPQLTTAPIWDECNMAGFCPDQELPDSGRNVRIGVIGFAQIFLEGVQGNNVVARLIGVAACGAGGGGPGGGGPGPPEIGPYSVPVRLVRLP